MDEDDYVLHEDLLLTKEIQSCKNYNVFLIVRYLVLFTLFRNRKESMKIIYQVIEN